MKNNLLKTSFLFIALSLLKLSTFGQGCVIAHHPLDNNAADVSGNSKHGTIHNVMGTMDRNNTHSSALQFNGSNSYISLASAFDYPQRTVAMWVRVDSFPTTAGAIYACDNATLSYGMTGITAINMGGDNKIRFNIGSNWQYVNNLKTKTWYHIAFVVNATHAKCFVDGVKSDSLPNNSFTKSGDGSLVANLGTSRKNSFYFKGAIDDLNIFNCALSNTEVKNLFGGKLDCLAAWYKLDGNGTDSKNGSNASVFGTTTVKDRAGAANSALTFNGTSDYVALGSSFDYPQRSITMWVKVEDFPTSAGAIYACDNAVLNNGMTGITAVNLSGDNKIRFNVGSNWQYVNNLKTNTWYHIAFVVNATHAKCFVNGIKSDSLPNNSFIQSGDGSLVANLGTSRKNSYYFKGSIDEVKIFGCALSNAEVLAMAGTAGVKYYQSGTLKVYPNPAKDQIIVEIPSTLNSPNGTITVINMEGRNVLQVAQDGDKSMINTESFANGIYMVRYSNDQTSVVSKVIINK